MVSLEKIEKEIKDLEESGSTTFAVCEKLATLYVVRDHLMEKYGNSSNAIGFETTSLGGKGIAARRENNRDREVEDYARSMKREDLEREFAEHMNETRENHPMEYENTIERMRNRYRR